MKNTRQLIGLLGKHSIKTNPSELTLYELGTLIIVSGKEAGFDVASEFLQLVGSRQHQRSGRMDCVWTIPGKSSANKRIVVVAWEIDGRDVKEQHLAGSRARDGKAGRLGNLAKFDAIKASIKIQALYSIRGRSLDALSIAATFFARQTAPLKVLVRTDVELMGGEIFKIANRAKLIKTRMLGNR